MAGVFPTLASSRLAAFLLFIILVWIAVDLGYVIVGISGDKLPGHVQTIIAPGAGASSEQAKI